MFNWVLTDLGNDIIRIQPQTNLLLCMDVDLLKNGAINNFPGNGQRIKLYTCHGGGNQQFRTLFWPLAGGLQNKGLNFWELKPLTYDTGQAQQCMDENTDVRVGAGNLVQQYECLTLVNNRYNQHWRTRWYDGVSLDINVVVPTTTTTTIFGGGGNPPPPPPPPPDPVDVEPLRLLSDRQTTFIHDPGRTRCLGVGATGAVTVVSYSEANCVRVTPFAEIGTSGLPTNAGFSLWVAFGRCITQVGSTLVVDDCNDTLAQQFADRRIGTTLAFTLSARGNGQCVEGATTGVVAVLGACNSSAAQIWADAPKSPSTPPTGTIPNYADNPDLIGDESADIGEAVGETSTSPTAAATFGGQIFKTFIKSASTTADALQDMFGFINPIHKLVQIEIAKSLSAAGQINMIECQLGKLRPDVCAPPSAGPGSPYKHAEIKPSLEWIMAGSTTLLAQRQLNKRDIYISNPASVSLRRQRGRLVAWLPGPLMAR
jgi:hypothetical protein